MLPQNTRNGHPQLSLITCCWWIVWGHFRASGFCELKTRDTDARPIQSQLGACGAAEEASRTHPGREAWAESRECRDFLLPWLCQVWRIQLSIGILGISELRLHSVQLLQKTILHDAAANVHWNLRVSPLTVTPPENKSLLRDYWGIMAVNNPQPVGMAYRVSHEWPWLSPQIRSSKIDPGVRNGHVWVVLSFAVQLFEIDTPNWPAERLHSVCSRSVNVPVRTISPQMLSDQWCISSSWQIHWEFWCMDSELIWTNEGKDTADWHISMSYKSLSPFQRNFNQDLRNVCLPECALDEFQALDTSGDVSVITIGFGVLSSYSQHLFWWVQLDLTHWKCKEWRQNTSTWVKLVYDIMFLLWYLISRIHLRLFFFLFVSLDINGSTDGWGLEHLKSLGAIDWLVGSIMGKLCRTWRFQKWSFLVASTTFDMKMSKHSLRQPYWPHLPMVSWDDLHSTLIEVEKSPFQMIL